MQQPAILCTFGDMARRLVLVNDKGYAIGEDHHRSKLTDRDVDQILELRDAGLGYGAIAAKFDDIAGGLSKSQVRRICLGLHRGQLAVGTKAFRVLDDGWRAFDPADADDFDLVVPLNR